METSNSRRDGPIEYTYENKLFLKEWDIKNKDYKFKEVPNIMSFVPTIEDDDWSTSSRSEQQPEDNMTSDTINNFVNNQDETKISESSQTSSLSAKTIRQQNDKKKNEFKDLFGLKKVKGVPEDFATHFLDYFWKSMKNFHQHPEKQNDEISSYSDILLQKIEPSSNRTNPQDNKSPKFDALRREIARRFKDVAKNICILVHYGFDDYRTNTLKYMKAICDGFFEKFVVLFGISVPSEENEKEWENLFLIFIDFFILINNKCTRKINIIKSLEFKQPRIISDKLTLFDLFELKNDEEIRNLCKNNYAYRHILGKYKELTLNHDSKDLICQQIEKIME